MPAADWLTPELVRRLEALELSVRWVRTGSVLGGRFAVNRRGSSIEFADHVPYAPGDDIRSIDWNLYARLDRLFVKTYKEEIELSVELLLDASSSMGLPSPEKFLRAQRLAVCLGYVALADRHHVRVNWIRPGPIASSRWFHQRSDRMALLEAAAAGRCDGEAALAAWVRRAVPSLRMRGGQAILLTDGMVRPAEFVQALHGLMARHIDVRVIQVLSRQELEPSRLFRGGLLVDVETGATHQLGYPPAQLARAVAEHNARLADFCKEHGIPFARCLIEEPLDAFLFETLPGRGFLR
jgi:uncharacterized protein (DUF58 family)